MNWTIPLWGRQITRHTNSFTPLDQIPSFESIICNAELLISYAANAGIQLDDNDIKFLASAVEEYKTTGKHHTTSSIADVLCIYSRVASRLPIDPPTLIQFLSQFQKTIKVYFWGGMVFCFTVVIVSLLTFVASTISDSIKTEIDSANRKIITLTAALVLPATIQPLRQHDLLDLQQFAMSARSISDQMSQLQHIVFLRFPPQVKSIRANPTDLEINVSALSNGGAVAGQEFLRILDNYQQIRAYAQNLCDHVKFWYGGVANTVLPVLYAILGVCASSLRRLRICIRDQTFIDVGAKEHILVAIIAGMLISLLSGFFAPTGVSLSPLAWAFLAGYSSDAFFQLVDGVLRPRTRVPPIGPSQPPLRNHLAENVDQLSLRHESETPGSPSDRHLLRQTTIARAAGRRRMKD